MNTYLFEPGTFTPLAKFTPTRQLSVVSDHLGTPAALYDGAGELVWQNRMDIYGRPLWTDGLAADMWFRYPGQYEDNETGLSYNRFRYYDAGVGCYISRDPIGLAGGNPTLYGYVGDVNGEVDVLGLNPSLKAIQNATNNVLRNHIAQIKAIDPNATIGYRGSVASGISKAHDPSIARAINPMDFDVDAFIKSDYLANDPAFTNRRRLGSEIPGIEDIERSIDKQLREVLPGLREEPFSFRIFKTHELDDLARNGDVQKHICG